MRQARRHTGTARTLEPHKERHNNVAYELALLKFPTDLTLAGPQAPLDYLAMRGHRDRRLGADKLSTSFPKGPRESRSPT